MMSLDSNGFISLSRYCKFHTSCSSLLKLTVSRKSREQRSYLTMQWCYSGVGVSTSIVVSYSLKLPLPTVTA
jgi:hypothetical protein